MNIDKNREFKEEIIDNDFNLEFQSTKISNYIDKLQQENENLKQQLKDKDEKISKVKELLKNPSTIDYEMYGLEYSRDIVDIKLLLEILESNKEE